VEGAEAVLGLSDYLQDQMGEITKPELADLGDVPRNVKPLDNNYIRGYNSARDTTYRSQRLTRLSPTAQRNRQADRTPSRTPRRSTSSPTPPACSQASLDLAL